MRGVDDRAAERIEPFAYGTAVVQETLSLVHDLNFLRLERGSPGADELAAAAEAIQGAAGCRHRSVDVEGSAEERLAPGFAGLGWESDRFDVMVARRTPDRPRDTASVEEVGADELRPVWAAGIRAEPYGGREEVVEQLVEHHAVTARAVPTRYLAARVGGEIASYCELYERDGAAQIESVVTLEPFRGRGLASALVLRALAEAQAGLVFLVALRDDWPRLLYRRLGFDDVGRYTRFIRR